LQPIGITLTIPPLVMASNARLRKAQLLECANQAGSRFGMTTDDGKLLIGQSAGLEEDLIWNGQLPKIMNHRRGVYILDLALIESEMRGKRSCE